LQTLDHPLDQARTEDNVRPKWGDIKFCEKKGIGHSEINYTSRLIGTESINKATRKRRPEMGVFCLNCLGEKHIEQSKKTGKIRE
jgi:hypothetical protein